MSEELIKKSDAIEAIELVDWYHQNRNKDIVSGASREHQAWYKADDVYKALEAIPTIEPKVKVVAQVTFDEEKLREIVKEAVERFKEEYEIVDRPQGEWIRISSLYSLDRTYRCSVCGKVIDDMPMDEYYDPAYKGCPYCFTRMKGADDD